MSRVKHFTLSADAVNILKNKTDITPTADGGYLILLIGNIHPRSLYDEVNRALEEHGAKWNRSKKGHVVAKANAERFAEFRKTLTPDTAAKVVNTQQTYQVFETPTALADRMAAIVRDNLPGNNVIPHCVLEPSAGGGQIVAALKRQRFAVTAIEVRESEQKRLEALADIVLIRDFMSFKPTQTDRMFDAVCMNPPFTGNQDIDHVMHASKFVRKGGVVVAIMSKHYTFATDSVAFRKYLEFCNAKQIEIPAGTFADTNVATMLVYWTV